MLALLLITFATSARIPDEVIPPVPQPDTPVSDVAPPLSVAPGGGAAGGAGALGGGAATADVEGGPHPESTFFLHDILGGSNPSAKAITGIVTNPALSGQVPFAKPNGAILPGNNGVAQENGNNNNNIPFLTWLGGVNPNVMNNNGNNNFVGGYGFPVVNGAQLSDGTTLHKLMFGTMMAIDAQLTEGHELGSGWWARPKGFMYTVQRMGRHKLWHSPLCSKKVDLSIVSTFSVFIKQLLPSPG